jgi:plasmid stabilization system protein ParE
MKYRILPPAVAEIREAVAFYESRVPGLGRQFLAEVRSTIRRIMANPEAWRVLEREIRRCRTHRFPYGIIYSVAASEIVIVSVMHLHRHPNSWRRNLES